MNLPPGHRKINARHSDVVVELAPGPYFSFTKSKTKIAQTPTVTGNCAACVSRRNEPPPLGSAKLSKSMAIAVSIPSTNLLFHVIFVPSFDFRCAVLAWAAMLGPIVGEVNGLE